MNKLLIRSLILLATCIYCVEARSESTLEVGVGVFNVQLPHYPGANQKKTYVLPSPYIYYSNDKVNIDRNQLTGYLWKKDKWHLDLSAGAGISVNSDDNEAREGMPDLDWVFELGPSLKYFISGNTNTTERWFSEFFIRKAIATDFSSIDDIGWRYGPSMTYQSDIFSHKERKLMLTIRANINYSDAKYLDYYYGVQPEFVSSTRHAYETKSGYAGSDISIGLTYKTPKFWYGGFIRYYALNNSIVETSPLFFKQDSLAVGFGFSWIFYKR